MLKILVAADRLTTVNICSGTFNKKPVAGFRFAGIGEGARDIITKLPLPGLPVEGVRRLYEVGFPQVVLPGTSFAIENASLKILNASGNATQPIYIRSKLEVEGTLTFHAGSSRIDVQALDSAKQSFILKIRELGTGRIASIFRKGRLLAEDKPDAFERSRPAAYRFWAKVPVGILGAGSETRWFLEMQFMLPMSDSKATSMVPFHLPFPSCELADFVENIGGLFK